MKEQQKRANQRRIITTAISCIVLFFITKLVHVLLPKLVIRVADIMTVAFIIFVIAMVVKTIPVIKEMWRNYCDETDKETMRALLGVTMALEYGIDINDEQHLKHGSPLKLLLNDVNWPKKFKQYKYQFGVPPRSDKEGVDTYALLHQIS